MSHSMLDIVGWFKSATNRSWWTNIRLLVGEASQECENSFEYQLHCTVRAAVVSFGFRVSSFAYSDLYLGLTLRNSFFLPANSSTEWLGTNF
jgi:hypothetical protein